jgi:single-stranded-DNA-specific exonuclease
VRHGLARIEATTRPGLRALMQVAGVKPGVTPETVGFVLGPRINAAGRTEHAATALELLLCEDEARALELARHLDGLNKRRREEEAEILKFSLRSAEEQLATSHDKFLVVGGSDYHLGVVGIVASRLVDRFRLPAVVLRIDPGLAKGSARSIPGFDVHEALGACDDHLIGWGGHAAAAGLQLRPENLDAFRAAANEFAAGIFANRDLTPELLIDADLSPGEFNWDLYRDVQRLQPFGEQNPSPLFRLSGVRNASPPRIVGSNHLKLRLRIGGAYHGAIGFNLGHLLPVIESDSAPFDVVFRPSENVWQGRTSLELEIVDARPAA